MGAGGGGFSFSPPTAGRQAKIRHKGPGGNDIGRPKRRKIGRIGGPTVGRGFGGKVKMCIRTVYKRIFMNFMVEFAKNRCNLYRLNSIYYCVSSEKPNLY